MATSVTQSLFGITPQSIEADRAATLRQQALEYARLDPIQQAQMGFFTAGSQLGSGLAGLMGYEDPEIAMARQRQGMLGGIDLNDPDALMAAAQNIQGSDPQAALALFNQANAVKKDLSTVNKNKYEMEQDQIAYTNRFRALKAQFPDMLDAVAQGLASDEEAFRKTFEEKQAKVSAFGQTLIDAGLTPGSEPYRARMNQYIEKELKKKGIGAEIGEALGASGVFDRKDVSDIVTQARQELKPFQELQQVTDNTFALFEVDNPKSGAQIDRNLARLSGDSQLSMAEVSAVANAGPFGQQVADSISRFFVGGSGDLSKQQKKDVVEALSVANVAAYNKKRNELINAYGLTGASSADLKRAVGEEATLPPKVMASFVKRSGFPYEPDKYVYRVGPNGSLQRKPKGK
jgi:hypothetical protein